MANGARKILAVLVVAWGAAISPANAGTLVNLSAEANRPAANDMLRASLYGEASGNNPADLARRVNAEIGDALKIIRATAGISVKSGQQSTYPVYGAGQKIEAWRMRSELILESRDSAAVSELLGRLQQMRLAVGSVSQMPSPETRRQVEDEATHDAIRAFQHRAERIAEQLGKHWKIRELNIQQGGGMPVPLLRASRAAMAVDAAPLPLEAGESQITTQVSGQIELLD